MFMQTKFCTTFFKHNPSSCAIPKAEVKTNLNGKKFKTFMIMRTLNLEQLEKIGGGLAAPWNNAAECNKLSDGLAGASLVWGFASLFTAGAGAVVSFILGVSSYSLAKYCNTLS